MRMAQDAIPGQVIPMWFKPIKKGSYEVVCGQLCGLGHYSMKGMLVVDNPAEYQAWLKERVELSGSQTSPAPADQPAGEHAGRALRRSSPRRTLGWRPAFASDLSGARPPASLTVDLVLRA